MVLKLTQADRLLAEGKEVPDVCRELGISEQTYYRWRNQFGGLKANDAKRWVTGAPAMTLAGEGWQVNHKKIQRLWRDEGLRVPHRRRRKRVGASTAATVAVQAPNRVWAVDFQFDSTTDGRPIKIIYIVDEHPRMPRRPGSPSSIQSNGCSIRRRLC